jgi:hypothetical protein
MDESSGAHIGIFVVEQTAYIVAGEVSSLKNRSSHRRAFIGRESMCHVAGGSCVPSDGLPDIVIGIGRESPQQFDVFGAGSLRCTLPRPPLRRCTQRLHYTRKIVPVADGGHHPRHHSCKGNDLSGRKLFGGVHQYPSIGAKLGRKKPSQGTRWKIGPAEQGEANLVIIGFRQFSKSVHR